MKREDKKTINGRNVDLLCLAKRKELLGHSTITRKLQAYEENRWRDKDYLLFVELGRSKIFCSRWSTRKKIESVKAGFFKRLPKYNQELLEFCGSHFRKRDFFDALVLPDSSREDLRQGLMERFWDHYVFREMIDSNILRKRPGIKATKESNYNGFRNSWYLVSRSRNLGLKYAGCKNVMFLDDCYHEGKTIDVCVDKLRAQGLYPDEIYLACYLDSSENHHTFGEESP